MATVDPVLVSSSLLLDSARKDEDAASGRRLWMLKYLARREKANYILVISLRTGILSKF